MLCVARTVARVTTRGPISEPIRAASRPSFTTYQLGKYFIGTDFGSKTPYHSRNVKLGSNDIDYLVKKRKLVQYSENLKRNIFTSAWLVTRY